MADLAPAEILAAYYPDGINHQETIPGGEINTTLLITKKGGGKTILQRLSKIYDASMGEDYEALAAYLKDKGWEIASALKSNSGATYTSDKSGRLWRSFSYIESVAGSKFEGDLEASEKLGGLLGKLHIALAAFDYQPKFRVPHFQDTDYYVSKLKTMRAKIPDPASWELATEMMALSNEIGVVNRPEQLIHGDTRIGNTLFRQGKPFTFIDWDGLKTANPLIDVGDMLQSTVGEVITKGKKSCSLAQLYPILEAYYREAGLTSDKQAFMAEALTAAQVIALNLGIRHLIDSVEDCYFLWDTTLFESRLAFNLFGARRQWQVHEVLIGKQSTQNALD
ncbi:MAG TPA: phosphotransferase [Candidatus Dormibacteraeota bacterium]|nr:phosphotransferase [Candidatus Dormibacteraeota bacterium]